MLLNLLLKLSGLRFLILVSVLLLFTLFQIEGKFSKKLHLKKGS